MTVDDTTLACGARVLTDRRSESRSASLGIWLDRGARDEPAAVAGATHMLEHLLFRAGPVRSGAELARAVDAVGGDLDATTSREHVVFHATVPASAVDVALACLGEVALHPCFGPADLDAERRVVLEELRCAADDHADTAHAGLSEALFPGHPLGREVLGSEASLVGLDVAGLQAHHTVIVGPQRVLLVAAGRVDHGALCQWAAGHLEMVTGPRAVPSVRGAALAERQPPPDRTEARFEAARPGEQAHVELGLRALPYGHPDRHALAVANHLLGGGPSSRLFRDVREERGLAYDTWSALETYSDGGLWAWGAATAAPQADLVEKLLREHLERLASDGPSPEEVADARGYLSGSTELSLERNGARATRLAIGALYRGGPPDLDAELAELARVDASDVRRVVADLLGGAGPTVSRIHPS